VNDFTPLLLFDRIETEANNISAATTDAVKPEWWEGTHEERMARRAARRGPEFEERIEARRRHVRYLEIWAAIIANKRVRGCGRAAKKAGFAD
jgi:hypothetical protein